MIILTTDTHPTKNIIDVYGFTKGSSVRAKNVGSDFAAGLKNLVGGEIETYRKLQDEARKIAMSRMIEDAQGRGANCIVGVKMVSTTISQGISELTIYGTAVRIEE